MKPLRELLIKLERKPEIFITFLYSKSIYSRIDEGYPTEEMGMEILDEMKDMARIIPQFIGNEQDEEPFVFEEDEIAKKVLPHRGNIAVIGNGDRVGTVIWFDDDSLEVKESLSRVIDTVGFDQLTHPYFF